MHHLKEKWNLWSDAHRPLSILLLFILLASLVTGVVLAVGNLFAHQSYTVSPTAGFRYDVALTASDGAPELIPGDSFSISPKVTNNSTADVYVFIRIHTPSYLIDQNYRSIYSFAADSSEWTVLPDLESASDDEATIVLAYGTADEMTPLSPGGSAQMNGNLTLSISNQLFADFRDNLGIHIHCCAVHVLSEENADETSSNPIEAYEEYLRLGGE